MTPIAPHIAAFLNERLPLERRASENTRVSYAYAFQLLFVFASKRLRIAPCELQVEHIDAALVIAFLNDLEISRGNAPSSRNIRLAAIKSFMRYLQYRLPSALDHIQRVLAIPAKKTDTPLVNYLMLEEMQAILDAPDPTTYAGVRDRAMLHLAYAAGLRVSELVGLQLRDVQLGLRAAVTVHGKGRRARALPLWKETARALRA